MPSHCAGLFMEALPQHGPPAVQRPRVRTTQETLPRNSWTDNVARLLLPRLDPRTRSADLVSPKMAQELTGYRDGLKAQSNRR